MLNLNLFDSGSVNINIVQQELWSTRLYIVLFFMIVGIVTVYTIFVKNQIEVRVESPSLDQYQNLLNTFSTVLNCPCRQISIPYKSFTNFSTKYHQVCTSDFVSSAWIKTLTSGTYSTANSRTDIRISIGAIFWLLSSLCNSAQLITNTYIDDFLSNTFFISHIITESQLITRIDDINHQSEIRTQHRLTSLIQLIRDFIHGNLFISTFGLNRQFWVRINSYADTALNEPIILADGCSCGLQSDCINFDIFSNFLPGFGLGCSIMESLIRSNLESLYNQTLIDHFIDRLYESDPTTYLFETHPIALFNSNISHYPSNSTVQILLNSLFIEEWMLEANYTLFYDQCSPKYCVYMIDEQKNSVFLFTRVLGLYGGLTVGLRFIAPYSIRFTFFLISRVRTRFQRIFRQET